MTIWKMEQSGGDVEVGTGTVEGVKNENPKIGENFYVFKKFINKKL